MLPNIGFTFSEVNRMNLLWVRLRFVAHAAARQWKKSATRLSIWRHRIAMIALAPSTDRRVPPF